MKITKSMLNKHATPCEDGLAWFKKQKDQSLVGLVKEGIKGGKDTMMFVNWGLCAIMTEKQRVEYTTYAAYQVAYLWKDKYPKEFKVWDEWASGRDRSDAAWDASAAAHNKMLVKILCYGVKLLLTSAADGEGATGGQDKP